MMDLENIVKFVYKEGTSIVFLDKFRMKANNEVLVIHTDKFNAISSIRAQKNRL